MRFKNRNAVFVILLLAACLGVSAQQAKDDHPVTVAAVHKDSGTPAGAPAMDADNTYSIGPEDVLSVTVWRQPELSAPTVPVRPDGKISLPLLNDVQASDMTPMRLAEAITEKLKKYVSDPRVTVVVTTINSKRIYVMGEVLHSGATPLSPNMTVLQALSSAGLNQFANTKGIYVLRTVNGKQQKLPVN